MTEKTLEEMMAEFAAKGGQVQRLESTKPVSVRSGLGNLLDIEYSDYGTHKNARAVFVVYLFDERTTVRMLTRKEDRVGIESGKAYRFSYRQHLDGKALGGIDFVTRGIPKKISKDKVPDSP